MNNKSRLVLVQLGALLILIGCSDGLEETME